MPILYVPPTGGPTTPPTQEAPDLALRVVLTQSGNRLELGTSETAVRSGSGAVWRLQAGVEGFDDPALTPSIEPFPGGFGGRFGGMTVPAREIFLPVLIRASGGDGWRAARRELDRVANPLLGDTTITVSTTDGMSRFIRARRKVEQAVAWGVDTWSVTGWQILPVLFEAASPWWRQPGGLDVEPWEQGTTGGFFSDHFFPLNVGSDGVFGEDRPILNTGQAEAWPVYEITADAPPTETSVTLTHVDTARAWTLDVDGLDGTAVVDTHAGTVTGPDGSNWWSRLSAPFDLWPLPPGAQSIRVDIDGDTAGITVTQTGDTLHFRAVQ